MIHILSDKCTVSRHSRIWIFHVRDPVLQRNHPLLNSMLNPPESRPLPMSIIQEIDRWDNDPKHESWKRHQTRCAQMCCRKCARVLCGGTSGCLPLVQEQAG